MENYPRLSVLRNVDTEAECLYRYVYGADDIFNPHCHEYYEIFITISGTVTHMVNGVIQNLPEGSLVFIRPDDVHGYIYNSPESDKTSYVNLTFTYNTANLLFNYLSDSLLLKKLLDANMPPSIVLNRIDKKRLLAQLSELNILNWQDKNALKLRMRAILVDIFLLFFYNLPDDEQKEMPDWLSSLFHEMEQPDNFIGGIDRMVSISQKSREHLARCIKKYCGITTAEYINDLRINYASNLLLHTNSSILDICFASGFQSVSYFYRVFKNKYSISPYEFRKYHKN
jgi:AraC family cel operon transcriptional repressor